MIVDEPHDSSEGQFNLFKGLESFFDSNPGLVKQTIFLSEGTTANKPISVQALIDEEPHPTDECYSASSANIYDNRIYGV